VTEQIFVAGQGICSALLRKTLIALNYCFRHALGMAGARKHLILMEDIPDNLDVLRLMLEERFDITPCLSCWELLHAVETCTPDLLLLDIGMPHMDGIECLRRIRAIPRLRDVPAIAVTAYAYPKDLQRCLTAGFCRVVTKPMIDDNELAAAIDEVLSRKSAEA
jgi:putative two-component system response regulator